VNDLNYIKNYAQRAKAELERGSFLTDCLAGLVVMWSFISRIPVPKSLWPEEIPSGNRILSMAPLAGAALGLLTGLFILISRAVGFSQLTASFMGFAFYALAGWTFHLDGWIDLWDGALSGKRGEEMRDIMKDSRMGAGGAVGLIVAAGLWISFVSELPASRVLPACLIAAGTARIASCTAALFGRYPWEAGMGKDFVDGFEGFDLFIAIITIVILIFAAPIRWIISLLLAGLAGALAAHWMNRRLGGVSGDVLGASAVASEIIVLAVFAL
jgi:adenosylcobinamide-GDP ribazoletransferase